MLTKSNSSVDLEEMQDAITQQVMMFEYKAYLNFYILGIFRPKVPA